MSTAGSTADPKVIVWLTESDVPAAIKTGGKGKYVGRTDGTGASWALTEERPRAKSATRSISILAIDISGEIP